MVMDNFTGKEFGLYAVAIVFCFMLLLNGCVTYNSNPKFRSVYIDGNLDVNGDVNAFCYGLSDGNKLCGFSDLNQVVITLGSVDTNWQTSYPLFDANMALRYYKQTDANNVFVKKSGDLMIGDLNLSTKTNTGMSIKSDKNRVCFQPNSCDYYVDWNGTDIIISWGA